MSISQNFSNTRPSLVLDFANSKKLDSRITFTRGSTGTYMDDNGLIRTAGINQPRFDHDPVTGDSLGLLVEESRANMIPYSEDFSTGWGASSFGEGSLPVITTNQAIAPDGTNTADQIVFDITGATTANSRSVLTAIMSNTVIGQPYVFSIWLKTTDESTKKIRLTFEGMGGDIPGYTGDENSSFEINGEWQRYTVGITSATDTLRKARISLRVGTTSSDYASVYAWGAQMENATFPTSYIPTSGSTVTRSADNASLTGTNFSSWYNQSEGTLFAAARVNALGGGTFPGITYVDDGTVNNSIGFYINDFANDVIGAEAYVSGSEQYQITTFPTPITANQLTKVITAYKANDFAASFSITNTVGTDNSGSVSTVNRLIIGDLRGNSAKLNGTISQLFYYPVRLSNDELQTLTK
jgi:hypothetical protein